MTGRLALATVIGTLAAGSAIGLLATSAWLISRAAQRPPVLSLMVAIAAVQAFGLGRAAFRYAERLTGHNAALHMLAEVRSSAYTRLERLAPAGLAAFRSGDLISRLVADIDALAGRWLKVRLPYAAAVAAGAGAVAVSAALLPAAGLVLASTLLTAAVAAPAAAGAAARRAERMIAPRRGELTAASLDLLAGAADLAAFSALPRALQHVTQADRRLARAQGRAAFARGLGAAIGAAAAGAAVWGVLALAAPAAAAGRLAGVMVAVIALIPLAAHEVFGGLAPAAQELPRLREAAARVSDVMARPEPVREPRAPAPLPGPPYDIEVSGLTVRWRPGGPDILRDLDLLIPAGHRVAIVGRSGSGKTTLAMALLRFLDPAAGTVTLGGADITALDPREVRTVVGLCAQDAHLFDSTLAGNLRVAKPDATDAELRAALARARLLDWADTLPEGLRTWVGEHGARLSGGQRQRLALARVLLAKFPIIVLDEPAEHLDQNTANALTQDLLSTSHSATRLLITHRPVDPAHVDQIFLLEHGRLAPKTPRLRRT